MKIGLKIAAVVGVVLFGLLAIMPLATAPEAKEDFQACADNGVCFTILATGEEVSPGPVGTEGASFDTWLYVTNPSTDLTRSAVGPEDNVVVESLTVTITNPDMTADVFVFTLEDPPGFADRWDPVVHASETKRVVFIGWGFRDPTIPLGLYKFEYELAMTFRGVSFTLAVDFPIEVLP